MFELYQVGLVLTWILPLVNLLAARLAQGSDSTATLNTAFEVDKVCSRFGTEPVSLREGILNAALAHHKPLSNPRPRSQQMYLNRFKLGL